MNAQMDGRPSFGGNHGRGKQGACTSRFNLAATGRNFRPIEVIALGEVCPASLHLFTFKHFSNNFKLNSSEYSSKGANFNLVIYRQLSSLDIASSIAL